MNSSERKRRLVERIRSDPEWFIGHYSRAGWSQVRIVNWLAKQGVDESLAQWWVEIAVQRPEFRQMMYNWARGRVVSGRQYIVIGIIACILSYYYLEPFLYSVPAWILMLGGAKDYVEGRMMLRRMKCEASEQSAIADQDESSLRRTEYEAESIRAAEEQYAEFVPPQEPEGSEEREDEWSEEGLTAAELLEADDREREVRNRTRYIAEFCSRCRYYNPGYRTCSALRVNIFDRRKTFESKCNGKLMASIVPDW